MLYNNFYFIFSSFLVHFALFLLHFILYCFIFVLYVLNWLICLFFPDEPFCCVAWNFAGKIFWGSHPGYNFGAIYYPSLPFSILILNFIFLYIVYNQFVTTLKRSFYHWDGFKKHLQKNSKNRFCYCRRVNTAGGHTTPHQIIPSHSSSYFLFPISLSYSLHSLSL